MVNSLLYRLGPETLFTRDMKRQTHFPGLSTSPWVHVYAMRMCKLSQ